MIIFIVIIVSFIILLYIFNKNYINFVIDLIKNNQSCWKLLKFLIKSKNNYNNSLYNLWKSNFINHKLVEKYWRTELGYKIFNIPNFNQLLTNPLLNKQSILNITKLRMCEEDFYYIVNYNKTIDFDNIIIIGNRLFEPDKLNNDIIPPLICEFKSRKGIKIEHILKFLESSKRDSAFRNQILSKDDIRNAFKNKSIDFEYILLIVEFQPNIIYCLTELLDYSKSLSNIDSNFYFNKISKNKFIKIFLGRKYDEHSDDYFITYVRKYDNGDPGYIMKNLEEVKNYPLYKVRVYWKDLVNTEYFEKVEIMGEINNRYKLDFYEYLLPLYMKIKKLEKK